MLTEILEIIYLLFLSSISSSIISSSAITMITSPGLPQYGALVVGALIILLCLKEILSASQTWNKYLNNSFNLALAPLLLCFFAILVFKVAEIIWFRNSGKIFLFFSQFLYVGQLYSYSLLPCRIKSNKTIENQSIFEDGRDTIIIANGCILFLKSMDKNEKFFILFYTSVQIIYHYSTGRLLFKWFYNNCFKCFIIYRVSLCY